MLHTIVIVINDLNYQTSLLNGQNLLSIHKLLQISTNRIGDSKSGYWLSIGLNACVKQFNRCLILAMGSVYLGPGCYGPCQLLLRCKLFIPRIVKAWPVITLSCYYIESDAYTGHYYLSTLPQILSKKTWIFLIILWNFAWWWMWIMISRAISVLWMILRSEN